MTKNFTSIIIGLIFIILGIGFLVDQLGLNIGFSIVSLWPVFLVFLGVIMILKRNVLGGFIVGGIGVAFLIDQFTDINAFSLFWPFIIIAIGVSILIKPSTKDWSKLSASSEEKIHESVAFWGLEKKVNSQNFKGGKIDCMFGGVKIDLSEAKIHPDGAELIINTMFGGVEIISPRDTVVISNGSGIFGGWENKTSRVDDNHPVLKIDGTAIFAGVEVK